MATILKDQSIINAGCTPIAMVYWRIVNMDTDLDILEATGGLPGADITGIHAAFIAGTYLEPDVDFAAFNGVATKIKFIKQIKDSCSNISPKLEMIFSADETTGNFEIQCEGQVIAFGKETQQYTDVYADDTAIVLPNIPLPGSVSVFKNNSLILTEGEHFTISGTSIILTYGSTEATALDPDNYIIQYAYQN